MDYYKKAIELLGKELDYKAICFAIASSHPAVFVKHAAGDDKVALEYACKALVEDGKKFDAIKMWRAETGAGLKEAKEAVEGLVA